MYLSFPPMPISNFGRGTAFYSNRDRVRIKIDLKLKEFFQDRDCILWALDFMSRCTLILINLIVISPLVCLVAEEVNGCVLYS